MRKLVLPLVMTLLIIFTLTGCEEEGFLGLGDPAPEYDALLDMELWLEYADRGIDSALMYEEAEVMVNATNEAFGYKRISQEKAAAYVQGDMVNATNTMVYESFEGDDSLVATILGWEPGNHDFSEGFDPSELYGILAIGNPEGLLDAIFEWLTESESFENYLSVVAGELGGDTETRFEIKTAIMTARGYWYTIQEDIYPLIGDELVIAVAKNPNYLGFDEYGDNYDESVPFKTLIAVETESEGLSDDIDYLFEHYLETLMQTWMGFSYSDDEEIADYFKVHEKRVSGYEIHYLNIDDEFMPGWVEYDGGLFISDLATLERIDEFYDSTRKVAGAPDSFNTYLALNVDSIHEDFILPFDEDIRDSIEWMIIEEEIGAVPLNEMYEMLESGEKLGLIQLGSRIYGDRVERILNVNSHTADILLRGLDYLKEKVTHELEMLEPFMEGEILPGVDHLEEE